MKSWIDRWEHDVSVVGLRVLRIGLRAAVAFTILVAAGLGAMWAAAHWLGWYPPAPLGTLFMERVQAAEPLLYVYDNASGWKPNPYTQLHFVARGPFQRGEPQEVRLRTNGEGFFDREHYLSTPYYRIAFLGDSWVEAQQVDPSLRFTNLVEEYVYARSKGTKAVETMNFGVGSLGTAQELGLAREHMAKYRPDEIWVMFYAGDDVADSSAMLTVPPLGPTYKYAADDRTIEDVEFGFVHPPPVSEARRRARYGEWSGLTFAGMMPYLYAKERHGAFDLAMEETRASIKLFKRLADSMGSRLVFAYIPARYEFDTREWPEYRRKARWATGKELELDPSLGESRIGAMVREEGAEFVSLRPLLMEKGADEMLQGHLSRVGHHWVADAITKRLLESACCDAPK